MTPNLTISKLSKKQTRTNDMVAEHDDDIIDIFKRLRSLENENKELTKDLKWIYERFERLQKKVESFKTK